MHGLGALIAINNPAATAVRRLALEHFPKFVRLVEETKGCQGLTAVPVIWGDILLAVAWHDERGQLHHVRTCDGKAAKKLFRRLPSHLQEKVLRSPESKGGLVREPEDENE